MTMMTCHCQKHLILLPAKPTTSCLGHMENDKQERLYTCICHFEQMLNVMTCKAVMLHCSIPLSQDQHNSTSKSPIISDTASHSLAKCALAHCKICE